MARAALPMLPGSSWKGAEPCRLIRADSGLGAGDDALAHMGREGAVDQHRLDVDHRDGGDDGIGDA